MATFGEFYLAFYSLLIHNGYTTALRGRVITNYRKMSASMRANYNFKYAYVDAVSFYKSDSRLYEDFDIGVLSGITIEDGTYEQSFTIRPFYAIDYDIESVFEFVPTYSNILFTSFLVLLHSLAKNLRHAAEEIFLMPRRFFYHFQSDSVM